MQECCPQHLRIQTTRMKSDKEIEEEGQQKKKYEKKQSEHEIKFNDGLAISEACLPS